MEGDGTKLTGKPEPDPEAPDEVLALLAHELRAPLSAILGALDVIRAGEAGELPPRLAPLIDMIRRNGARMQALVDDLLDAERVSAGRLVVDLAPVDLAAVARAAIEEARALVAPMQMAVELSVEGRPVMVTADPRRLGQALGNLLSNAARFAPPGDRVEVTVAAARGRARVTVADRGPGIPAELQPHIFERFWTRDAGDGRNRHGLGLGLGIARALVAAQDGRLGFASRPGDTRFWIDLPLLPAQDD